MKTTNTSLPKLKKPIDLLPEYWVHAPGLQWVWRKDKGPFSIEYKVLQQMLHSSHGGTKWEDVPTIK